MGKKLHVTADTSLQKAVKKWVNSLAPDYDDGYVGAFKDLFYGGCESGMVGDLIYYSDTIKFYKKHRKEIHDLLREAMEGTGAKSPSELFRDKWDPDDPLADETNNQNLLAWFGFEEAARYLADKARVDY